MTHDRPVAKQMGSEKAEVVARGREKGINEMH